MNQKDVKRKQFVPQILPQSRCFTDFGGIFCEFAVLKPNIEHFDFWGTERGMKSKKGKKKKPRYTANLIENLPYRVVFGAADRTRTGTKFYFRGILSQ